MSPEEEAMGEIGHLQGVIVAEKLLTSYRRQ